jgi:molybdate transport system ATP-binding protein
LGDGLSQPGAQPLEAPALLRVRVVYGVNGSEDVAGAQQGEMGGWRSSRARRQEGLHLRVEFCLTARRSVLFGASGAGKSTLLRLLAGLLRPAQGVIVVGGVTVTDIAAGVAVAAGRRGIGYLTQEPALFPHLSAENNIAYGLHGLGRDARRERVAAMLALFSLESLARRMPARLSGGERQRVALARALAPGPRLLLLDEAFAGLDAPLRETTTAALEQYLQTRATTLLSVSHDVAEVYASGAEVLLLEDGRITQQGPSQEVLAPQRERLLRLLGVAGG